MDQPIEWVFSTKDVASKLQLAYWREAVAAQCGATSFKWTTDRPGNAAVTVRPSSTLNAMECVSSPARFKNTGNPSAAAHDYYNLTLHISGKGLYCQKGNEATATMGDLVLTDVTEPFEIAMGGHRVRSWSLPRTMLEPLLADSALAVNAHIPGSSATGALLNSFLGTHWSSFGRIAAETATELDSHLCHLVALALGANRKQLDEPWGRHADSASRLRHVVHDPRREQEWRKRVLEHCYGLTAAEASFALEIAKGDGRNAAARRRGISSSTAHTHLTRIFEKTGAHRQAELVRLLFETWMRDDRT